MRRLSELHDALKSGDQEKVATLLHDGANIEEYNGPWTPLMVAAWRGNVDLIRLLLDHGANLYAVNIEGHSALHMAAMRGGADAVRLLVRRGADVNVATLGGRMPLHLAAAHCNRNIVQNTCAALLEAGADVNARSGSGCTPLWSAAVAMRSELVEFLLRHGAELDARDHKGRTTLMYVAQHGVGEDVVGRLLAHGADVNARDTEGRTALMYVSFSACQSAMELLLDGGADIDLQDMRGTTALMYAAGESPKASEIGMLGREAATVPEGGNAPKWDKEKKAARLAEAYHWRAEIVRHLLERGADPEQRDAEGRTALDKALENAGVVGDDNAEVVLALMSTRTEKEH